MLAMGQPPVFTNLYAPATDFNAEVNSNERVLIHT